MARKHLITVIGSDRSLAKHVGRVLSHARLESAHIVDAHLVAVATENGNYVILTGDAKDLTKLAAPYGNVHIEQI